MAIRIEIAHRNNFYSARLKGEYLALYYACIDNLSRGVLRTSARIPYAEGAHGAVREVINAIIYGCPELFFIEQQVGLAWSGEQLTLEFTSKYPQGQVAELYRALTAEVERISALINRCGEPFDKLNLLNDYLCLRVKPVQSFLERYGDAYGALILKEARCEGFAKAAALILDRCGIDCVIAHGQAASRGARISHAWVIAAVNGTHYHFDFAWNASRTVHGVVGVEYLFLGDSESGIEHFPEIAYPPCPDDSMTFWARNNSILRYQSDLSRIKIVPARKGYLAIAKLPRKLTGYEVSHEVSGWMIKELSAYSFGRSIAYNYNEPLDLLVFYFLP